MKNQQQPPTSSNSDVYQNQIGGKTAYNFKKAGVIEGPGQAGIFQSKG